MQNIENMFWKDYNNLGLVETIPGAFFFIDYSLPGHTATLQHEKIGIYDKLDKLYSDYFLHN